MVMYRLLLSSLALASTSHACERNLGDSQKYTHGKRHVARQADFPPVLTAQETILVNSFDNNTIDQWSNYYTHRNNLAGLSKEAAQWTADKWSEYGFTSHLTEYEVYLNYPISASLHINFPNGTVEEVNLVEDSLPEDEVTNRPDNTPTFHGYSASGNVSAEYVYVGQGKQVDFDRLIALGIQLEGKIALAKYGGPFRGLKVKNAQAQGMIGVVLFTDTDGDGEITVANGYEHYPNGPARHPSAVQKGSVLFLSTSPGDPTTPGYPSKKDVPRAEIDHLVPQIPSLPISYAAAQPLLQALDGHGVPGQEVNGVGWVGALNATYSTGPAPGITLSLHNLMEAKIVTTWNAIGYINGTNSDETIVVGNHRDTWMIGGAGDAQSGSAVLIEMSKAFGKLLKSGWKPKRNIVLASWDAEEYGIIGSTEWVEEYASWLNETSVAYLNVDVAVFGPWPTIAATPELHEIATEIFHKVIHPNYGAFNISFYDAWNTLSEASIGVLGSGSDYTAFVHHGIGSFDVMCGQGPTDPIYHYHSNYDTYNWMTKFGDPGFHVHSAVGQYLTLLAYHLADDQVVPFDLPNYGAELEAYYVALNEAFAAYSDDIDTSELWGAIQAFQARAKGVKDLEQQAILTNNPDLITAVNHKYRDFQRGFVSQGGLPDREFYKHVVVAPGIDTGYAAVTFPGITEALDAGNLTRAKEWVGRTSRGILQAADILKT
ncbi:hypothetical protein LZ554_004722 [Drepanopeziza brunnea f. sp. 'monogermtubi']|nr:hypothetical protein LZ554_004722 [Drepanopeziza brunnea f. sp. 'monogermtubi']